MAERRFPKAIAWPVFLVCLLGGAALLMSDNGGLRILGLGLLLMPLVLFLGLQLVYYLLERRHG